MPFTVTAGDRELALDVTPGGFVQANAAVNQTLVDELVALAPAYEGRPALDLYCGAGNFTLPAALRASAVVGVEDYAAAARDARANASGNDLRRVRVLDVPAHPGLEILAAEGFRPDFTLLDPPREGAAEVVGPLADLGPGQILYVSCSPPTLARDLKTLTRRGYRIEWTRIADMFPQTAHVESLTLLCRS
jgi:23S rRNA (uracil1939-C5)-methyltransferase